MKPIDLRSDTVTKPTPAMRDAMAKADVGDDVYLEDPTVNRLQERAAELFGFEAALFVPTGSMGNQICVRLHTEPGTEVILDAKAHIYNWELGSLAAISGVVPRLIATHDGHPTWDEIAAVIAPPVYYRARTALICLENTHNMHGGTVCGAGRIHDIAEKAHEKGLKVHIDGARIFNAAAALETPVKDLVRGVDSVMFCLSKGLGAPSGSLICGSRIFIERARVIRKMLGGGMRQVGVLAAPGLIALEEGPGWIAEDHANARHLAELLSKVENIVIDSNSVKTNIVIFSVEKLGFTAAGFVERLVAAGVLAGAVSAHEVRFVTHHDVSREECERTVQIVSTIQR